MLLHFVKTLNIISVKFLEGWDIMQKNGYSDLTEGPEAGWLGYYSLDKQGRMAGASLGDLITAAGAEGLVWTDPQVQPHINMQLQLLLSS